MKAYPKMDYYLALKRNELSSYEKTQRNPKCILQSERRQCVKATYHMIAALWGFWKKQNRGDRKKITGCQG